jgi:protein-L-isoaspartate(D-aspartate) O-methyltransferase
MGWRRSALAVTMLAGLAAPALAQAPADPATERAAMVRDVELEALMLSGQTGIEAIDPRILRALGEVPRHAFVPAPLRAYAYQPHPLPLGHEQNLAAPLLAALLTQLVAPEPDDVVFETGTDSGYQAALLSLLAAEVYSVEVVAPLAELATQLLKELGYDNVVVREGDGYFGWAAKGPFDAMVIKEAIDHVPPPLLQQLARGGRMVIPLGPARGPQYLTLVTRDAAGKIEQRRIMPVRFSPLQGGERT